MKFELTYERNGIFSANVVYAADEKAARAWYERVKKVHVVGCQKNITPYNRPGAPIVEVPMNYSDIVSAYPV